MKTTNVKPGELNYDHYSTSKYDLDIINSIPFHQELHEKIIGYLKSNYNPQNSYSVLDLGVGTGITSILIKDELPKAHFDLVDFSKSMLAGARKKMGTRNVTYILADYSKYNFKNKYDIIVSVIGMHHQNNQGKKLMFKKIYSMLKQDGVFILGDLVTYKNHKKAALNQALHMHHLVEKSSDQRTLEEWAYHHLFLNDTAPIEDQLQWLKQVGFKAKVALLKFNTALIINTK